MQKEEYIRTRLFLVRLWNEELGDGESEMRGRLQDVSSGETSYFRDWEGLVEGLKKLMAVEGMAVKQEEVLTDQPPEPPGNETRQQD